MIIISYLLFSFILIRKRHNNNKGEKLTIDKQFRDIYTMNAPVETSSCIIIK